MTNIKRDDYYKVDLGKYYPSIFLSMVQIVLSVLILTWGIGYESKLMIDLTPIGLILSAIFIISFPIIDWINFIKTYKKEIRTRFIIQSPTTIELNGEILNKKDIKKAIHYSYISNRLSPLDLEYVKLIMKNNDSFIISELLIAPDKLLNILHLAEKTECEPKKFYHFIK